MKKILTFVFGLATLSATAQTTNGNTLAAYYGVKDALVQSNITIAAQRAQELITSIEAASMSAGAKSKLLADARKIVAAKDIEKQRHYFSTLSDDMIAIVQDVKPAGTTVYKEYCPMKKAYWLSSEQEIQNPYYGKSMLTCGKVVETIK